MKSERREFLKKTSIAVASLALAAPAAHAQQKPAAKAGAPARLDEKDATAQALGYVHDASKADRKKFANWKADQTCANCTHYQAKPADPWGPCAIFPGKQVAGKGWCSAWVKKA
jgi:hypothetical protein